MKHRNSHLATPSLASPTLTRLVAGLVAAAAALAAGPAASYTLAGSFQQPENRDGYGRVTVEASVIHTVHCTTAGENGRGFYVFQYVKRPGFRAISPPNWGAPIGGRDFATFQEAAAVACGAGVVARQPAPAATASTLTGAWKSSFNIDYNFVQTGNTFTWYAPYYKENAQGTIQGDRVSANWGSGSGTGTVSRDASGRAVKIAWDNGVVMTR